MSKQLTLAVETPQITWKPLNTRFGCNRDPDRGPGACTFWWEGCPKAEKRNCYRLWATSEAVLNHWSSAAPAEFETAPADLPPATAGRLKDRGEIEIREPADARWQWRRRARTT